jgi:hypothetical protein
MSHTTILPCWISPILAGGHTVVDDSRCVLSTRSRDESIIAVNAKREATDARITFFAFLTLSVAIGIGSAFAQGGASSASVPHTLAQLCDMSNFVAEVNVKSVFPPTPMGPR